MYILFYSNYCIHSKKFIGLLEKSNESYKFAKICVDRDASGNRPKSIYNYNIKRVPTIIVENEKLYGFNAFKWLQNIIKSYETSINPISTHTNKQPINISQMHNNNNDNTKTTIQPMSSSLYPNITDSSVQLHKNNNKIYNNNNHKSDEKPPCNWMMLDDNITSIAMDKSLLNNRSNVMSGISTKDKLKSKQLDNEFNKLKQEREQSVPQAPRRI